MIQMEQVANYASILVAEINCSARVAAEYSRINYKYKAQNSPIVEAINQR